jgi:hypothetical protein
MLDIRRCIAPAFAAVVVAGPLLYFHLVGRQSPLLVGYCGCLAPRDVWRYGWPAIYGTRIITQAWQGEARSIGPLERFSGQSLFWNVVVSAVMVVGSIHVVRNAASGVRKRQISLRSLLLLPAVAAGVCTFVKYDRSPDLLFFLVPSTPARFDLTANPIIFRPQAITDFPLHLSVPILIGVASGIYSGLSAVGTLVVRLCRVTCRGSTRSPARSARYRILAIVALLCLIGGTAFAARAAYRLRTVCRAAVFGKLATEWVTQYVWMHNGEWPRSWDALRECLREYAADSGRNEEGMIESVQAYVAIDFQADWRVLARQTAREFRAIRSLDGYGVDHQDFWDVPFLIDILQDLNDRTANKPQPQSGSPLGGSGSRSVVD